MQNIRVLQIGGIPFNTIYQFSQEVHFTHWERVEENPMRQYDVVILDRDIDGNEFKILLDLCQTYRLFATNKVRPSYYTKSLMEKKLGQYFKEDNEIQNFFSETIYGYRGDSVGTIMNPLDFTISRNFKGDVTYLGGHCVCLKGDFGKEMSQIGFYRTTIPIDAGERYDLWVEYEKEGEIQISLTVVLFPEDSISEIEKKWVFTEKELKELVTVQNFNYDGKLYFSIHASGTGTLRMKDLHYRQSRRGIGNFMPCDQRIVTKKREEIFYYFEPGNGKAPLNVFFSDYKETEGFEGLGGMRSLGHPFLLISECRMGGGAFYLGDAEFEKKIRDIIQDTMKELGFNNKQVILSGISMGAFAAFYYGCDLKPHGIIAGRPLLSVGDVARNERIIRPGGWPYPLDVMLTTQGDLSENSIDELNNRFWMKYKRTDFSKTKFAVAYMMEDDYDATAYQKLLENIKGSDAYIYGKGIHGRHNDEKWSVVNWFRKQYERMTREGF